MNDKDYKKLSNKILKLEKKIIKKYGGKSCISM